MSVAKNYHHAVMHAAQLRQSERELASSPHLVHAHTIPASPSVRQPAWIYPLVYAMLIALFATGLAWMTSHMWELGRIDNGDGWRVLRRATVFGSERWLRQPVQWHYEMAPFSVNAIVQSLPKATSGLLVFVLAILHRCLGFTQFHVWTMVACYLAIYLFGAGCWVRAARTWPLRGANALLFSLLLLNPFTLSYFNSFYEEAAVFALMPWWTYQTQRSFQNPSAANLRWFYVSTAAMLLSKTQMTPVLLVAGALHLWRLKAITWQMGLIALLAAMSAAKGVHQHEQFNAFNRVQNGLAYSVSGVSHWASRDHEARQLEAKQRVSWQSGRELGLPDDLRASWGGGFWPDGVAASDAARAEASHTGKVGTYLSILWMHPSALGMLIKESYLTAAQADFTMAYIYMRHGQLEPAPASSGWQALMAHLGWLYWLAAGTCALAFWQRNLCVGALTAVILISPLFVVLGDGYYEFEKHLLPYLSLSIGIAACLLAQTKPAPSGASGKPV